MSPDNQTLNHLKSGLPFSCSFVAIGSKQPSRPFAAIRAYSRLFAVEKNSHRNPIYLYAVDLGLIIAL